MSNINYTHEYDDDPEAQNENFSDSDEKQSWHSPFGSSVSEIEGVSMSDCGSDVDLEKKVKDCRICHLSLVSSGNNNGEKEINLGCSCKGDLAAAHNHCAQKWFKIKGDAICEICGSTALNVAGEHSIEVDTGNAAEYGTSPAAPILIPSHNEGFWQGRHVMKFLLAVMVFAFVISWFFHYNIRSSK